VHVADVLDQPGLGEQLAAPAGRRQRGRSVTRAPRTRAFIVWRAAVHIDLAAARVGCAPSEYFVLFPSLWRSIARRAIADLRDFLAGDFPANGLTDREALREASLWRAAWMQPLNDQGNRDADSLRLAAARLRERGIARVRERRTSMQQAAE
jgi:hypothetical protein